MIEITWMRSSNSRCENQKSKTCIQLSRSIRNLEWAAIASIVIAFTICGAVARAQQPTKVPRVGYLSALDPARESSRAETIRLALRELGYAEGRNITFEYRYTEGKFTRAPEQAADLVRFKVDIIIVAGGEQWVRAVKNATKTIPIVMVGRGSDPVEAGLVESLARPGGNVTGITRLTRDLGGKRLELLKEAVPKLSRGAVLYDPAVPGSVIEAKERSPAAARALGLIVRSWEVRTANGLEKVFAAPHTSWRTSTATPRSSGSRSFLRQ
ncbi:MAG: ABC transporter substrate-binding protein [Candidatus Binatia bacterium]